MAEYRPPLGEMIQELGQDQQDDLRPYLAVALVPIQVMISESRFPTEEDKRALVKQSLEEMGFAGSAIQSVELVPPGRH